MLTLVIICVFRAPILESIILSSALMEEYKFVNPATNSNSGVKHSHYLHHFEMVSWKNNLHFGQQCSHQIGKKYLLNKKNILSSLTQQSQQY